MLVLSVFYFNSESDQSMWQHPMDEQYRQLYVDLKRERHPERTSSSPNLMSRVVAADAAQSSSIDEANDTDELLELDRSITELLDRPTTGTTARLSSSSEAVSEADERLVRSNAEANAAAADATADATFAADATTGALQAGMASLDAYAHKQSPPRIDFQGCL